MSGRKKHTIQEVRDCLCEFGYRLISTEYFRHQDKLVMKCDQGHICDISFKNFKNGKRCRICSNKQRGLKQRTSFEDIIRFASLHKIKILSKEDEYNNRYSKLAFKCSKGHLFETSYASFKASDNGCPYCGYEKISIALRKDCNEVYNNFIDRGFIPMFNKTDYMNSQQLLPYICLKHKSEGIKYTTYNGLKNFKYVCKSCCLDSSRGEKHWNWQGGISSLVDYFRIRLNDWKIESLKEYNFKCALSGRHTKNLEIHHLYSFSSIIRETIASLNVPIHKKISDYKNNELEIIENRFFENHKNYGLGIPLIKEIHTLYHKLYGFQNNTPHQFEEFKIRYENNEFNNVLKEVARIG